MQLTLHDLGAALRAYERAFRPGPRDLPAEHWALISELFPEPKGRGRPPEDAQRVFNGVLWIARTGAPWRDLPPHYGHWKTVHDRFSKLRRDGTLRRVRERLIGVLDDAGEIDWDLWCIDGTNVRASRSACGARKKGAQSASRKTTR